MTKLVRRDKCKPLVKTEAAQKRMRPAVGAEIAAMCLFQERQCPFADTSEFGDHGFLTGEIARRDDFWRFAFDDAGFDEGDGEMKALEETDGPGGFADDAVGTAEGVALDLAEMGDNVASGPAIGSWGSGPVRSGDGVGGVQEALLRSLKLFEGSLQAGR